MKLSIIIPVFRTQATLERCIQSVLNQSFTDYELILVDDGSPDECPQLCDDYAKCECRIKVIHKENGGLSDARNTGIDICQGEYITFIDSDDTISENTLQPLMDELALHPAVDILEYPVWERYGHPRRQHHLTFSPHDYDNALDYWLSEKAYCHTYAWNKIYRRHLFQHIRFPKGKTFEDAWTTPRLIGLVSVDGQTNYPKIRVTDTGCYMYHWNDEGITAKAGYKDLHLLYEAQCQNLIATWHIIEGNKPLKKDHYAPLQDLLAYILNIQLDLYDLCGEFEECPSLIHCAEELCKTTTIRSIKLRLLLLIGYRNLCRLNKLIHRVHKRK